MSNTTAICPVMELRNADIGSAKRHDLAMLHEVSWQVNAGEFWVIGALPGAGKSGLLSTIAGLIHPLSGDQRLFGQDLDKLDESGQWELRRRIGMVFDDGGRLFNRLTVMENVALPLVYHDRYPADKTEERVAEILAATNLEQHAGELPRSVTRSTRQRTSLARALALEPEVLLLDNPLSGLDPLQTRWWLEFLTRLYTGGGLAGGRKMTLVVACENFQPWLSHAGEFALIKNKRWVPLGKRESLEALNEPLVEDLSGRHHYS